jgi:hypothetical protein
MENKTKCYCGHTTYCDCGPEEPKQRLEKYSERFDNDESAIGNPETWGKRVLTEEDIFNQKDIDAVTDYIGKETSKQETTIEEAGDRELSFISDFLSNNVDFVTGFRTGMLLGAKWQQERSYSEEDLNKHVIEFLEWRQNHFSIYHGNKNRGLYYARWNYDNPYFNQDKHTALTRRYYNFDELLELFNQFKNK